MNVTSGRNVLMLRKDDDERYVFVYDDDSDIELLKQFAHMADDRELSFNWSDAATLSIRMRELKQARIEAQ